MVVLKGVSAKLALDDTIKPLVINNNERACFVMGTTILLGNTHNKADWPPDTLDDQSAMPRLAARVTARHKRETIFTAFNI